MNSPSSQGSPAYAVHNHQWSGRVVEHGPPRRDAGGPASGPKATWGSTFTTARVPRSLIACGPAMDEEDYDDVREASMAYLLAQSKRCGCTCPEPLWGTWADVQIRWEFIDPDQRAKLEWYRSRVEHEGDMVLLDHLPTCPLRRAGAAWLN